MPKGIFIRTVKGRLNMSKAQLSSLLCKNNIKQLNKSKRGIKLSEEHRKKIALAGVGRKVTEETRIKIGNIHRGKIVSEESRKRMSLAKKGKPMPWRVGEKNNFWKGGVSKINRTERRQVMSTLGYENWRRSIFERDNYTCQKCGQKGGELRADHIKPWAIYPELRFNIKNGQTLCRKCHREKTKQDMAFMRKVFGSKLWPSQY